MLIDLDRFNQRRVELNSRLAEEDAFFAKYGALDDAAYSDGTIPKAYKELIGIAISIVLRCDECVAYHLQEAEKAGVTRRQAIEAIRIGVVGCGSTTIPTARTAISLLDEIFQGRRG